VLGQRTGVGADAQWSSCSLGSPHDLGDLVGTANIAGVDAHRGDAGRDRLERERRVEVDVGDNRQRRAAHDLGQGLGVGKTGHGAADDLAAGRGERLDLSDRRGDVAGAGSRHRLHGDGGAAADLHAPDRDLTDAGHAFDCRYPAACYTHRHRLRAGIECEAR